MSHNGPNGAHVFEQLSAFIDDNLGEAERERVRGHLEACPDCRAEYDELRATQVMLRSMPVMVPARVFTLTEELVASAARVGFWQRLLSPRNTPRFATGSVLAFVLLLLVFAGNATFAGGFGMGEPAALRAPVVQLQDEDTAGSAYSTPDLQRDNAYNIAPPSDNQDAITQPFAGTPLAEAMAEPTATTDAAMGGGTDASSAEAAPTAAASTAGGAAPEASPAEAGAVPEATPALTPAMDMGDAASSSVESRLAITQDTTTLNMTRGQALSPEAERQYKFSVERGPDIVLAIEVLLAMLGVALGAAAVASRRA